MRLKLYTSLALNTFGSALLPPDMTTMPMIIKAAPTIIGTPATQLNGVVYDTGSGDLLVKSQNCPSCAGGNIFDFSGSSTYAANTENTDLSGVTYMDGTALKGYWGFDTACVTSSASSCANNFNFSFSFCFCFNLSGKQSGGCCTQWCIRNY